MPVLTATSGSLTELQQRVQDLSQLLAHVSPLVLKSWRLSVQLVDPAEPKMPPGRKLETEAGRIVQRTKIPRPVFKVAGDKKYVSHQYITRIKLSSNSRGQDFRWYIETPTGDLWVADISWEIWEPKSSSIRVFSVSCDAAGNLSPTLPHQKWGRFFRKLPTSNARKKIDKQSQQTPLHHPESTV